MKLFRRRDGAIVADERMQPVDRAPDPRERARADAAADVAAGVPDPDAESVVDGVRQPAASPHVYADESNAKIVQLGGEAKSELASIEQDYLRLPRQIRDAAVTATELSNEIRARGDFGRERPIARFRHTAMLVCVAIGAPIEVKLTELSVSFANLTTSELRLISVGAVLAMNLVAIIAIRHQPRKPELDDRDARPGDTVDNEVAA